MVIKTILAMIVMEVVLSAVITCDFQGTRCVTIDGVYTTNQCTKYYAICTECGIQTAPIPVADMENTSCYNGAIIGSSLCNSRQTCDFSGIHCTDSTGTEVSGSCTAYYTECIEGTLVGVSDVAPGTKCLNDVFVPNRNCTTAECTYTNIQCTNGAGEHINTYCTSYFVECVDGQESSPMDVPAGSQCYQNQLIISSLCSDPICSFEGIKCSDASGTVVLNTCSSYYVECDNGYFTNPIAVASGTQCYDSVIVNESVCSSSECTTSDDIICCDSNGVAVENECSGFFKQCSNGVYTDPETVPSGTKCYNGAIVLSSQCLSPECTNESILCTDASGNSYINTCTSYYRYCAGGVYEPVAPTATGQNCLNGKFVNAYECSPSPYECDFTGIRCSTDTGTILYNTCSAYYVMCDNGYYTKPLPVAEGTRCYNSEQVDLSACSSSCNYEGIRCSDYYGEVITGRCTNYYVECVNGVQESSRPVAAGTKCLDGEQVLESACSVAVCTNETIKCVDVDGLIQETTCTDEYIQCDNGQYSAARAVPAGTKCLAGSLVLSTTCSGVQCSFEGIECSDADGTISTDLCMDYFVSCDNGYYTSPKATATGTKCYNGLLVNSNSCDYINCDFEGIKCTDASGVVYDNTCTSYFLQCQDSKLGQPQPVADGTRCYKNGIVSASRCSDATCSYDGIKCTDADGTVYPNSCTSYYVECDNGKLTAPRPVADGVKCYNGTQILSSNCGSAECSFEGIECSDANGNVYPNTCTAYFIKCDNGKVTGAIETASGTSCLAGTIIMTDKCTGIICDYEGIKCVDANNVVYENTCTDYYTECDNGIQVAPRPVADGTKCYNGEQVSSSQCSSSECTNAAIQCTNATGSILVNTCTNYYVECDNGVYTAPRPVANGTRCYNGEQILAGTCNGSSCTDTGIRCTDADGTIYDDTCTLYYVNCDNGVYTAPRPVADGTRCYNGEQIEASQCTGVQCSTVGISCSDSNGNINGNSCTSYYVECDNGYYTMPRPVAVGTYCLKGEMVLPYNCTGNTCDFTGIKCSDSTGQIYDTTCMDYYLECDNGFYTAPLPVASGTKCYGGKIVLSSVCTGETCSFTGKQCTDQYGVAVANTVCSGYYIECVDGTLSNVVIVGAGSSCYDGSIIDSSQCGCSFTGIRCTDAAGAMVTDKCTQYYTQCNDGVISGPIITSNTQRCKNNALVEASSCGECSFDGFVCSTSGGSFVYDECTGYYMECSNSILSSPLPVASGQSCYNQQIISSSSTQCTVTDNCSFEGIHCANEAGTIVYDRCTSYYVMCSNGKVTKPALTAAGTKCYNDEQIITSQCSAISCSFTGIMCLNSFDDYVMNTCTTSYATCTDNVLTKMTTESGKSCYDSQIVDTESSVCTVAVEVQESKMKGIRGRRQ